MKMFIEQYLKIMTLRTKTDMLVDCNLYESFAVDDIRKTFYNNYYCEDVHRVVEYEVWETTMSAANFVREYTNEFKFQS